ncbi:MAG: hypothetical protein CVU38_02935 [Chloroflexi bacterium HGW-Chloroflexi-1]|nr:MAG: hypothetical protein CVU38_02935 [Chloroflexi bacterium HGW-Chloroflexi-1]
MLLRRLILIAAGVIFLLILTGCTACKSVSGQCPQVKWRVHIGTPRDTRVDAPVAVAKGMVFVGASERRADGSKWGKEVHYLQGLRSADGGFVWHCEVAGYTISRPVVQNDVVYFASGRGRLYASKAFDGQVKWAVPIWDNTSAPVLDGSEVYLASNQQIQSPGPGSVIALNSATGIDKWQARPRFPIAHTPAVSDHLVFVADGDGLLALERETGREHWRFALKYPTTTPAVLSRDLVYVADSISLYSLEQSTGRERWRFTPERDSASIEALLIRNNTAFIVLNYRPPEGRRSGTLIALDLAQVRELWRIQVPHAIDDEPTWDDGLIYLSAEDYLYAVNVTQGKLVWRYRGRGYLLAPVVADDVLYLGDWNGDLTALILPR